MIPFMYFNNVNKSWVVMQAKCFDMKAYDASWMDDADYLPVRHPDPCEAAVLVPDLDIVNQIWVFDQGSPLERERNAIKKMKELWAQVSV